ncbi:MAG: hypothetical protein CL864_02510 [Cyanobium sp. SAT1300]|nr:hypothetical protein [Cyanobium sp. SAT1300]|tara:strand:- start:395 stop:667 length:273 start_codon:yes stop_codon:yes gene_type:complete
MNFRLLCISAAAALLPSLAPANTNQEMNEGDFLDLVDAKGHITVQGNGVADVNAKAKAQGLNLPGIGYWSPEGHCFIKPAPGPCNGVFKE